MRNIGLRTKMKSRHTTIPLGLQCFFDAIHEEIN